MTASIIICYNDVQAVNEAIALLKKQTVAAVSEIIAIDNRGGKYISAAQALNYGASCAKGETLIFMHQDVLCESADDIERLIDYLNQYDTLTLVGVAGIDPATKYVCSNITETREHIVRYSEIISEPKEVETVDECLFAVRKTDYDKIKFDETTCNDWHLYAVDLSYAIKLAGGKVISVPVPVCHLSKGNANINFYKGIKRLGKKYKNRLKYINTTCIQVKNNRIAIDYYIVKKKIGNMLRKLGLKK